MLCDSQLTYALTKPGWKITQQLGWRKTSPNEIHLLEIPKADINAIVELDHARQIQWIAIRGTSNFKNWLEDLNYIEKTFSLQKGRETSSVELHCGFYQATKAVFQTIEEHLKKGYQTRITGHSLGGAIAAILTLLMYDKGYIVDRCITFGQPRITNHRGAEQLSYLPLLRIINQDDIVPTVPISTLLNWFKGGYAHFGAEIELKQNSYTYLEQHDNHSLKPKFWWRLLNGDVNIVFQDIQEHYMKNYLQSIISNLNLPPQANLNFSHNSLTAKNAVANLDLL